MLGEDAAKFCARSSKLPRCMKLPGIARMQFADFDIKKQLCRVWCLASLKPPYFLTQSAPLQDDWGMKWSSGHASHLRAVCISRHMYETVAREFVLGIPNVKVQTGAAVSGLEYDASTSRVTGKFAPAVFAA